MKNNFNKILLVCHEKQTPNHLETIAQTIDILKKHGKEYSCITFNELHDNPFKNKDLVSTIGGDGTFIRTTHFLRGETPILGINSEPETSEGGLTTINRYEIDELNKILDNEYKITKKPRARAIRNRELIPELALNEVYIGSAYQFHTSRYIIKYKGLDEEQRSSGVLVVTGSGSHAWYKSAGGTSFNHNNNKLKFIVREPFSSRIFNPEILKGDIDKEEKISFISKRRDGGIIAIDSYSTYDFNDNDYIEVRVSSQPLNVITKSEANL